MGKKVEKIAKALEEWETDHTKKQNPGDGWGDTGEVGASRGKGVGPPNILNKGCY